MSACARRATPRLLAITDRTTCPLQELPRRAERLLGLARAGTVAIALRDRDLDLRTRLGLARDLRTLTRSHQQWLLINDRLDLALVAEADGVHLGEQSVTPEDARRLLGPTRWIFRACHDPRDADPRGADGVLLSPILAPRKGAAALGTRALAAARERIGAAALYALGGVDACGATECLNAGADGVAAIGAALGALDPEPLLRALGILKTDG